MLISVLKSKIAYAKITDKSLYYEGSITLDEDLMERAHLIAGEQVQVVNLNNGERIVTYTIIGERGSGVICLNGPAARRGEIGDPLFILSYAMIDPKKEFLSPTIINLGEQSR